MSAVVWLVVVVFSYIGISTTANKHNSRIETHSNSIRNLRADVNTRVMWRHDEQAGAG